MSQIALIPVAYTLGTTFRPAERRPVAEFAYLDDWDSPWPT